MTWTLGIDVSKFQNVIDWPTVVKTPPAWIVTQIASGVVSPLSFAWIRIGQGTQLDPQFERNWHEAQAQGLRVGAYYAAIPGDDNPRDPIADAQAAAARLFAWFSQVGGVQGHQMGVALDWEINPHKAPVAYCQAWGAQFCAGTTAAIKNPHQATAVYSYQSWWTTYGWSLKADQRLWAAHPVPTKPQELVPGNIPHWAWELASQTKFWQFGQLTWPGITGNVVDVDVYTGAPEVMLADFGWTAPLVPSSGPTTAPPITRTSDPATAPAPTPADTALTHVTRAQQELSQAAALLKTQA